MLNLETNSSETTSKNLENLKTDLTQFFGVTLLPLDARQQETVRDIQRGMDALSRQP